MTDISETAPVTAPNSRTAATAPRPDPSSIWAFRGTLSRRAQIGIGVGTSVGLLLVWEAVTSVGLVNTTFLPSPSTVLSSMLMMVQKQNLLQHCHE